MAVKRIKWAARTFDFSFPAGIHPEIIERLRGTPARVAYRLRDVPADILTLSEGSSWSIQEHVGHLLDLEPLFSGRLDDFEAGAGTLRPADMTNRATSEAGHKERFLGEILGKFQEARAALVSRLEAFPPEAFERTALHPRLKVPMRLVDSLYFQAEHDDYHLARITELVRRFDPRGRR